MKSIELRMRPMCVAVEIVFKAQQSTITSVKGSFIIGFEQKRTKAERGEFFRNGFGQFFPSLGRISYFLFLFCMGRVYGYVNFALWSINFDFGRFTHFRSNFRVGF